MSVEEYLRQATEMERRADASSSPEERLQYLRMAKGWRSLAEAAERSARPPPPEKPED